MPSTDIGIDLGTTNTLVYARGKGIVIKEPSVVAYDKDADKIKAIGEEARQMLTRSPGNIVTIRPLRQGTISDYSVTEAMLKHFIQKAVGRRAFRKPSICMCVPNGITEIEKKAVEEATYQAGARSVTIVEELVAAAIGAGIDVTKPFGNMIVDIGGGTTDIAVISLGGTVVSASVKVAGDQFDEAIVRCLRKNYSMFIGTNAAEEVKMKIGTVYKRPEVRNLELTGRNVITGLPKTITLSSEEVRMALADSVTQIVEAVHGVLEKTPPELAADVADRGIILTGGGSLLDGLEELIEERTGINTMTAERPAFAVAEGTGRYLEIMEKLGK